MKCYHCQSNIPDGSKFCTFCGQAQSFDQQLVAAAAAGDNHAITELYNRTYSSVYHTVKFLIKDDDTALDIVQDSYLSAFRHLATLKEADKFGPWVKRIAHNRAVDYLRRAKPVMFSEMVSDDSEETVDFADDRPENSPDMVIDRQETARLMGEILDSLPEDQRACVTMYYYEQLSVKEIAEELDIPEATVKSRLIYGRNKIESQVRALERRGTKLYGFTPIPLLLVLLHSYTVQAAEMPAGQVLYSVLSGLAAGTAGTGAAAGAAMQQGAAAHYAGNYASGSAGGTGAVGAAAETAGSTGASAAAGGAGAVGTAAGTAGAAGAAAGTAHAAGAGLGVRIAAIVAAIALIGGGGAAAWRGVTVLRERRETAQESAMAGGGNENAGSAAGNGAESVEIISAAETPAPATEAPAVTQSPAAPAPTQIPTPVVTETPAAPVPTQMPAGEEPVLGAHMGEDVYSEYLYVVGVYIDRINTFQADPDGFRARYDSGYYDGLDNGINYHLISEYLNFGGEMWFAFNDLNLDGTPELVLGLTNTYHTNEAKETIEAYTFNGLGAKQLFHDYRLGYRTYVVLLDGGRMLIHGSNSAASGMEVVCRIADDRNDLEIIETYTYDFETDPSGTYYGDKGDALSPEEFFATYEAVAAPADENTPSYPVSEEGIQEYINSNS
ncbi:MAG: sigma-70 family RNA polymerase sigma factor [Lachnospiraceae bacterium]|nr:sigma-70 family RNA polymerase sigma factor [Lachnospiraceae bacterium]